MKKVPGGPSSGDLVSNFFLCSLPAGFKLADILLYETTSKYADGSYSHVEMQFVFDRKFGSEFIQVSMAFDAAVCLCLKHL